MRSFRLLFHLLPNECLDLVERNKRHAALFAVVSDMNQLPISALFALVIKTARKAEIWIALQRPRWSGRLAVPRWLRRLPLFREPKINWPRDGRFCLACD
jgi:hypothetical protein